MKILLRNARVYGSSLEPGVTADLLIDGALLLAIRPHIRAGGDTRTIDLAGKIVAPGLVDVHVHFRQPGQEQKEDIHSGSRAAAAGGFTTVIAEPNTLPPSDTPARVRDVLRLAGRQSIVRFHTKACISKGTQGRRLADIQGLRDAGAAALSDDGHPVPGAKLMRHALERAHAYGMVISPHCEESEFYRRTMTEKLGSGSLGPSSGSRVPFSHLQPYRAEAAFIRRDLALAEQTGAWVHISHVSLAESVQEIAGAKRRGVPVTAEAAPHHFLLTEKDAAEIGPDAKVNPPLRSEEDVAAVRQGLADGTIDAIATDHAPHTPAEKALGWDRAPFGVIGLETSLGLVLTHLVRPGVLTLDEAIRRMSANPARIFRLPLPAGTLQVGAPADLTVIDPEHAWTVNPEAFYSKARNCPFRGWHLTGKAVLTMVGGRIVMRDGIVLEGA